MKVFEWLCLCLVSGSPGLAVAHAWCEPDTLNSYGPTSPVITRVTFATINRSSPASDKELYVHTLLATDVELGSVHAFSMEYAPDPVVCPEYAIRVWIDWSHDESFDEPGDLVVARDHETTGSVVEVVQVPDSAVPGLTRMRVAMKMEVACGHDPIAACPEPEAFGWHGEVEDYDLVLFGAEDEDCRNGVDDDGDGAVDCDDADCLGDATVDCDGDGVPNGEDCAPDDPGAFAVPPEVPVLRVARPEPTGAVAVLTWPGLAAEAGLDTVHDVFTGRLAILRGSDPWDGTGCLARDEPGTTTSDPATTATGMGGYWYLVRAENACGQGPLGAGPLGGLRAIDDAVCR